MKYDKYDLMYNSMLKNIRELVEQCVDSGITNAYDLMDAISFYAEIIEKAKKNNGKVLIKLESGEE